MQTSGSSQLHFNNLTNKPITLAGYGISDAMNTSHAANGITDTNISNWNTAFGWGNHSGLYRPIGYVPTWSEVTSKPTILSGFGITDALSTTLSSTKIIIGNSSNIATATTLSGDATVSNTGVLTIENNAVNSAKITNGSIVAADLNQMSATSGQTLKWDGTTWVASSDFNLPPTSIVLSETSTNMDLSNAGYTCIGRIQHDVNTPISISSESWTASSTATAPSIREQHCAVWTGSEMIIWGGKVAGYLNSGSKYNPTTDSWTAMTTTNAPSARAGHTAIWTGSEMIVWGGINSSTFYNTGGKYNPLTDTWTSTSLTNVPDGRGYHTAIWTGSEMIIWGGSYPGFYLNSGSKYNPFTDSWTTVSTTGAPSIRQLHSAIWTGSEMIIWGGGAGTTSNTGGKYNPITDTWTNTSLTNTPPARIQHSAIWTGTEMIIWGGWSYTNTGGKYNPNTDTWTATTTTNAPAVRTNYTAVWTGSEMIIWGGTSNGSTGLTNGGIYSPLLDSWKLVTETNTPLARFSHTAIWSNSEMIVFGGRLTSGSDTNTGGRYVPEGYPIFNANTISTNYYLFKKN